MSILKVARMGHPVLRAKARTLDKTELKTATVQQFIDSMIDTMYKYSGVGLAAPQVHESLRVFVAMLDADGKGEGDAVTFVNPEIIVVGDQTVEGWEGCLSIPEMRGRVPRAQHIRVSALDRNGKRFELELKDFPARVIQHETDHLDGVLFLDRMRGFESLTYLEEYTRDTTPGTQATTTTMSKTVVVTGGGRGIGRAIALAFAAPGAHIIITSRTATQLEQTAGDIKAKGAEATAIPMDVTDDVSVAQGFGSLHGRVTSVDVLVNNAGVGGGEIVQGSDVARWRRTIDTNLTGMYLVTRQVLPLMADGGRIINLSSVLGRFGVPGYTAYCASKHGVIGFTRALALETLKRKITVNAVAPGWVDTDMAVQGMAQGATHAKVSFDEFKERQISAVPIKRIIDPSEVAGLIKYLCSPEASAITGQTYNICGGQTMA